MSLDINSVSASPQAPLQGLRARQGQLHVGGYPLVSQLPQQTPSVPDTTMPAIEAMREFVVAAQSAAAGIAETDPMKPIANGIARDLGEANGDVFAAMGKINDLQNAFNFTMQANATLMEDPALAAIA